MEPGIKEIKEDFASLLGDILEDDKSSLTKKQLVDAEKYISNESGRLDAAKKLEEIKNLEQDRDLRKRFSNKLYWLIVSWLILVGIVVFLDGFFLIPFDLSDTVLVTLITTTTANVLGLFVTVTRYLFPAPAKQTKKRKAKPGKRKKKK